MRPPVPPAALEPVEEPAIGEAGEMFRGDRGSGDIAAQALETIAVLRGDGDARWVRKSAESQTWLTDRTLSDSCTT